MGSSTVEELRGSTGGVVAAIPTEPRGMRRQKSPPKQPRNFRSTPSRSPSPTPIPTEPSLKYLAIASQKPTTTDPHSVRKLLVLDLNGALLVRSAKGTPFPRPFMPNFRDYLFHDETRKWLDVMVWSSAQPRNVDKMVRRCFFHGGADPSLEDDLASDASDGANDKWEGKLVAVWARDTLGLSQRAYFKKTQTTKDLDKPWSQVSGGLHSARTTMLLDDSPLKARLQPYNHLCVSEYNGKTRTKDLQSKSSAIGGLGNTGLPQPISGKQSGSTSDMSISSTDVEAGDAADKPVLTEREKRRKEKKQRKKQEKVALAAEKDAMVTQCPLDEMLLAVIGILDEIKLQKNVASWIKHGGLWAGESPPVVAGQSTPSGTGAEVLSRAESPTDAEIDDDGESSNTPPSSQPTLELSSPPSSPSSKPDSPSKISKRQRSINNTDRSEGTKKGRSSISEGTSNVITNTIANEPTSRSQSPHLNEDQPQSGLGIAKDAMEASIAGRHNLWFENPHTLAFWVKRGRSALRTLAIREDDGIEMDQSYFAETYKH